MPLPSPGAHPRIHEPDRCADSVLGLLAQSGHGERGALHSEDVGEGHTQRGARRQSGTGGQGCLDVQGAARIRSGQGDHGRHQPGPRRLRVGGGQVTAGTDGHGDSAEAGRLHVDRVRVPLCERRRHAEVDGHGQGEALVVVGVVADEVDPAGAQRGDGRHALLQRRPILACPDGNSAGRGRRRQPGVVCPPASSASAMLTGVFRDLLQANERYAAHFDARDLRAPPTQGLAVLTCMDSRIDPQAILGLPLGAVSVVRNAGGRATGDALRSLTIATRLLGVRRVVVLHHSDCALAGQSDTSMRARLEDAGVTDAESFQFLPMPDPDAALLADVESVRTCPLLPKDLEVVGWRYDEASGRLAALV